MFVGRERELKTLEKLYQSDKFEFAVIYGRRRVGKTTLIHRFTEGKNVIYFTGIESSEKSNLENFSRAILEYQIGSPAAASFSSFQTALESVFQLSQRERIILVIDEYPYVARAVNGLASILQLLIDRYRDSSRMMLILCGSSMSYIEDQVLAYKSPLYGRRTAQLKLLPFDFREACDCFTDFSEEDRALIYGIAGGTPQYLLQMDDRLSVEENIKNTFLNPSSLLFEEPENLLKQEVREPALYNAIITAVANGATRMAEISSKTGEDTSVCTAYLKNLISLGLVRKETPYGEKESRKSVYTITGNMFRFWYRFVPGNYDAIVRGAADLVYQRIQPQLSDYMGKVFEEICAQYLWKQLLDGQSPVAFSSLGRWWGTDPGDKKQAEIDIMGEQDPDTALFAECKWTNEKVDKGVLDTLTKRSGLFSCKNTTLYLFAKTGFTGGCIEEARARGNVKLITYREMLK